VQLSVSQTQELLKIIDRNQLPIIGSELGTEFLTDYDKKLLKDFGIDISGLYKPELSSVQTSFHFGMLAEALGALEANKLTYTTLKDYIKQGNYIPISEQQKATLNSIKMQTFSSLKSLNGNIFADINNVLVDKTLAGQQQFLADELKEGTRLKQTMVQISHGIAEKTGDWNRNFDRIIITASQDAYEAGKAAVIQLRNHNKDPFVYKNVFQQACGACIKAYLTHGIRSQPIIFKLSELRANGTNIGRKKAFWLPVVGTMHPHCFDEETEVLTDQGWKYFKDLNKTERFLSFDVNQRRGEWVYAKNWVNQYYEGKMHHFSSDTFDLMTTPNHHHVVKKNGGSGDNFKIHFIETKDLINSMSFIRTLPEWYGEKKDAFIFDGKKYDPFLFCEFLGYYLSEGHYSYNSYRHTLTISQSQEKYFDEMAECCVKLFENTVQIDRTYNRIIVELRVGEDKELIKYFKKFGCSYEKFIPNEIKNLSIDLLMRFLDAYRMGDGGVKEGQINHYSTFQTVFYTSSNKMANDLSEIIIKIGYSPSLRIRQPEPVYCKVAGKYYLSEFPQYIISFNKRKTASLEATDHHEVTYKGFIYDVDLEKNHTLFVRRNGKVTSSGNCRCSLQELPEGYLWNKETQSFSTPDPNYLQQVQAQRPLIRVVLGGKELYL
jgi:hypothetical protein